jgi:hypothetical protein
MKPGNWIREPAGVFVRLTTVVLEYIKPGNQYR